eukprot:1196021-Prymnesium_polylepis.4
MALLASDGQRRRAIVHGQVNGRLRSDQELCASWQAMCRGVAPHWFGRLTEAPATISSCVHLTPPFSQAMYRAVPPFICRSREALASTSSRAQSA